MPKRNKENIQLIQKNNQDEEYESFSQHSSERDNNPIRGILIGDSECSNRRAGC